MDNRKFMVVIANEKQAYETLFFETFKEAVEYARIRQHKLSGLNITPEVYEQVRTYDSKGRLDRVSYELVLPWKQEVEK